MQKTIFVAAVAAFLFATPVIANDSIAQPGTGGVQLGRSDVIEI